jgi:hypothetical protein
MPHSVPLDPYLQKRRLQLSYLSSDNLERCTFPDLITHPALASKSLCLATTYPKPKFIQLSPLFRSRFGGYMLLPQAFPIWLPSWESRPLFLSAVHLCSI